MLKMPRRPFSMASSAAEAPGSAVRVPRAVKLPVTQHDAFEQRRVEREPLERRYPCTVTARAFCAQVEQVVFAMRFRPGCIDPGDALPETW
jgi:hypothetical protein